MLNEGQQKCLEKLIDWWESYDGTKKVFEIIGAAGTGKSFIIKYLIESLEDITMDNVLFVAFVGKAAIQMTRSGVNACTIHSAIYYPVEVSARDENGKVIKKEGREVKKILFKKRDNLDPSIKLIVVDEAAMVDKKLAQDLLSFKIPIIALGDKHQLPPIFGDSAFLNHPDFELTEIMRQKAGSSILGLAQEIINSKYIYLTPKTVDENLCIIRKKDFFEAGGDKSLLKADVVICGKNSTRDELNKLIRRLYLDKMGYDVEHVPELIIGEKIICRKNNWFAQVENINLINGLIGYVTDIDPESLTSETVKINFKPDFIKSEFCDLRLNLKYFLGSMQVKNLIKNSNYDRGELFELGYAITCHLSQGSQYKKVIVFCERLGDNEYFKKWLYTAVTRASEKLIVVI
ncbi:MAG: ATP-dependent RecD-like DNA helicase [Candidatus Onthovivens sp.]|nr:ATP-dependent RecD-like DNA helicase [Candidatus Onthovivens sp.]